MTTTEAREVLESYYDYIKRKHISVHIWDALDRAIITLGGEGDHTLDRFPYRVYYAVMKTNPAEVLKQHTLAFSTESLDIPEIEAMQKALKRMQEDKR